MPDGSPLPDGVAARDRLLSLVDGMAGQPVVMLADLVADRFIDAAPKRISREAPVLILKYEGERITPGGGANAVANVAALGGRPLPLGVVGDDDSGRAILAALDAMGVDTAGICTRPGYRTPTKVRVLAGGRHSLKQQVVRFDIEDELDLGLEEERHFARQLGAWDSGAKVAVLSDYGYGTVRPGLVAALCEALADGGVTLGDSRHRLHQLTGLDGATPNEEEAESLIDARLDGGFPEVAAAVDALRRRLRLRFLVVTRGRHGMVLATDEGAASIPVHGTDQVADVTGAGDTVIGTFALALAAGATPLEAALLADYAGGVVVMKMGTATLSPEELRRAVAGDPAPLEGLQWAAR